jgi:SAM-dependent methyltransferase
MTENIEKYKALLETLACNLCGEDDYIVVYPPNYKQAKPEEIIETFRSSGDEVLLDQLVQCSHCGLLYLNPRLRSDIILEGYSSGEDQNFISQAESRERTFAKSLKLIEKYKPNKGNVLDIGTAGGSFLKVARDNGWQVAGCEPNQWLCDWASQHYDLEIVPGTIFDMQLEDEHFDVITLWDVLEHTPDPTRVLHECYRVLKPGGVLLTNIPDFDSLVSRLMGRKWVFLLSIHLYYFTPKTIRKLLEKTGFRLLKHRPHWQTLELGYIFFRAEAYMGRLARLGGKIAKTLRINHLQIPYNMGQTLIFAERK